MSREIDFILVFDDYVGKEETFLKLLRRRWSNQIIIERDTLYGIQIRVRTAEFAEPAYMVFGLDVGPRTYVKLGSSPNKVHKTSGLRFYTDTMSDDVAGENLKLFYNIFFTACKELKPVFGSAEQTEEHATRPCMDQAEYYHNPYIFCVEPPLFGFGGFNPLTFHNFLNDEKLIAKLKEIEKIMSRGKLLKIIRQHVEKVIESNDGGIGVLKGRGIQACYPRFFIRQELRKRGIELEEGLAENYAKEFGVE